MYGLGFTIYGLGFKACENFHLLRSRRNVIPNARGFQGICKGQRYALNPKDFGRVAGFQGFWAKIREGAKSRQSVKNKFVGFRSGN